MNKANPATALDLPAIAQRLRWVLKHLQLEATVFSERTDVPYSTMRSYLSGKRAPSPELLAAAYRVYRVSPVWLLTAEGQMVESDGVLTTGSGVATPLRLAESSAPWRLPEGEPASLYSPGAWGVSKIAGGNPYPEGALMVPEGAEAVRPLVLSVSVGDRGGHESRIEYQVIPRRSRPAAAGTVAGQPAGAAETLDLAGDIAFTFDWLRRNMGQTVGQLSLVQVEGTSMSPTLLDGETIMIDEGISEVVADDIYVLEIYGRRLVKRVQHLFDGTLVLISDNNAYQAERLPRDVARDVRVVGRMVWPRPR